MRNDKFAMTTSIGYAVSEAENKLIASTTKE